MIEVTLLIEILNKQKKKKFVIEKSINSRITQNNVIFNIG